MDINNYSYTNNRTISTYKASYEDIDNNKIIFFDDELDFFGERVLHVYNVLGDEDDYFPYHPVYGDNYRIAYEKAARFYNTLVPEENAIPLF